MEKEFLMTVGTVAVWVAAFLTIVDRLLTLNARFRAFKEKRGREKEADTPVAAPAPREIIPSKYGPPLSYLVGREIMIIVAAGVLLNYLGLVLSARPQSILYLDMTGTALAAFLLGPWWGAVVALLSNSVVNWLLSPEPGAELLIFPWSVVNMTGAFFWGYMARWAGFRRYLRSAHASVLAHIRYLVSFGALGACVMSIPGTLVQAALSEQTALALNPAVTDALQGLILRWQESLQAGLGAFLGGAWGDRVGWAMLSWAQNCLRYLPDKTISVAIALVVLKYGFPLFELELIHGGPTGRRPGDDRLAPLILGLLYVPSFAVLLAADLYSGSRFWPLWLAPVLVAAGGYLALRYRGPSEAAVLQARQDRAERYARALKPIEREPAYHFSQRLTLITLIAGMLFALALPFLLLDYSQVTVNFFCLVYGFLLAIHLVRVAIAQNLSLARATALAAVDLPEEEARTTAGGGKRAARK